MFLMLSLVLHICYYFGASAIATTTDIVPASVSSATCSCDLVDDSDFSSVLAHDSVPVCIACTSNPAMYSTCFWFCRVPACSSVFL